MNGWVICFTKNKGITVCVNDLKLNLPARFARYYETDYEKENFIFFNKYKKDGMTCIDVGAHLGLYSILMAKKANASVCSFEPSPIVLPVLKKNILLNHCENRVTIFPLAIAGTSGKKTFHLYSSVQNSSSKIRVSEANSLVKTEFGKTIKESEWEVDTITIDDFTRKNKLAVDFIKIDAEGAEIEILDGARQTFLKDRPCGILGIHNFAYADKQKSLITIWNTLKEYGFTILFNNKEIFLNDFMAMASQDVFDIQFLPKNSYKP